MAGLFKAGWKLLYALSICDFEPLNKCFFPMQTTGFVLAGLGVLAMVLFPQKNAEVCAAAAIPVLYTGTMLFVALMVLGVVALDGALIVVAVRRKKLAAVPVFVLSFVFVLSMGYLSSKDFTLPAMNWLAEGVNTIGQGAFFVGAKMLADAKKRAA